MTDHKTNIPFREGKPINPAPAMAEEIKRLRGLNAELVEALRYALENGIATQYWGDDDDCGTHSCCGEESYKPHTPDCWTVKAHAALTRAEGR